ncbi:hypothetical protein VTO42DRAFT_5338 [Malbranchea cinnamomea]
MEQCQQYWLPGFGLSRHVVLGQIHCFLGPTASVRPFTYQGREGYLISGSRLTPEQIQDLASMSEKYEREASMRMSLNLNKNSDGKVSGSIHELIPVAPRDDRNRERIRERERVRDMERERRHYSDRRPRSNRSW